MVDTKEILSEKLKRNTFSKRIDADRAFIVTLSDLHIGMGDRDYIKSVIDFILSVPTMYVIVGGDCINNTIRTSKGCVLEEYASGQDQINLAVEYLKPLALANRIIAICGGGNHEKRSYDDCFISIPQTIATLLGVPNLYTSEIAIGYINVGKIYYMYGVLHKHRKTKNFYDYMNMDILILEHTHELNVREKLVLEHDKFERKSSVKTVYEVDNGSALALPSYAQFNGYRSLPIGCYIAELNGINRDIIMWKDIDLCKAIGNGYRVGE